MQNTIVSYLKCKNKIKGIAVYCEPDTILTLQQVARRLRLDPRTVKKIASLLGGRRIGYRWRFRWGTVLEYFSNAYVETGQRKLLDGESHRERQADSLQNVPGREKTWPGMAGRKRLGGRAKKARTGRDDDPHGIRTAYGVGR